MICRLIDERYPDYENVIPADNENNITIGKAELLSSLKRIAIYANKTTHQVRLKITGSELMISSEDLDSDGKTTVSVSELYEDMVASISFAYEELYETLTEIEYYTHSEEIEKIELLNTLISHPEKMTELMKKIEYGSINL